MGVEGERVGDEFLACVLNDVRLTFHTPALVCNKQWGSQQTRLRQILLCQCFASTNCTTQIRVKVIHKGMMVQNLLQTCPAFRKIFFIN